MKPVRLQVLRCAVAIAALVGILGSASFAQMSYPDKPVRILVGFTPGSATDITARIFAQRFSEAWNVPVTVENVPGAGGTVAADRVAKAMPDGYTLAYVANGAMTIAPALQGKLGYDSTSDFAPISLLLQMASILAVNNDVPAKTFQDLLALAKAQPGKLSYASPGSRHAAAHRRRDVEDRRQGSTSFTCPTAARCSRT